MGWTCSLPVVVLASLLLLVLLLAPSSVYTNSSEHPGGGTAAAAGAAGVGAAETLGGKDAAARMNLEREAPNKQRPLTKGSEREQPSDSREQRRRVVIIERGEGGEREGDRDQERGRSQEEEREGQRALGGWNIEQQGRQLPAETSGEVDFTAPEGKGWRPNSVTGLKCDGDHCDALLRFCLIDLETYQAEPWKWPLEVMLEKMSKCGSKGVPSLVYKLSTLRAYMKNHPQAFQAAPSGFIFHHTRCGSTLAANMLAHVPTNLVMSEASIASTVLKDAPTGVSAEQRRSFIKDVYRLMAPTSQGHTHAFFKFQSAKDIDTVTEIFPSTPWVYLFRNSTEVLVSNLKGAWGKKEILEKEKEQGLSPASPGGREVAKRMKGGSGRRFIAPCLTGHGARDLRDGSGGGRRMAVDGGSGPERQCSNFLTAMNRKALSAFKRQPERGMLVEYSNMPAVMIEYIVPIHFGMAEEGLMEQQKQYLVSASEVYSKSMGREEGPAFAQGDDKGYKESFIDEAMRRAVTPSDVDLFNVLKGHQKWTKEGGVAQP